jgi:hypothetical protein
MMHHPPIEFSDKVKAEVKVETTRAGSTSALNLSLNLNLL